jgi:hypothetical protein
MYPGDVQVEDAYGSSAGEYKTQRAAIGNSKTMSNPKETFLKDEAGVYPLCATRIQRWFREFRFRLEAKRTREVIHLLRPSTVTGEVKAFLERTQHLASKFHPVLLQRLREKYLNFCKLQAEKEMTMPALKDLANAVDICGGIAHSRFRTDFDLKRLLKLWEDEMAAPGVLEKNKLLVAQSNQTAESVRNGNDGVYILKMVEKGVFDNGSFPLSSYSKLKSAKKQSRRDTFCWPPSGFRFPPRASRT